MATLRARLPRRWVLLLAAVLAFELLLLARPVHGVALAVVDELLLAVAGFVAAGTSLHRSRREEGSHRGGWAWFGAAMAVFGVSQVGFAIQSAVESTVASGGDTPSDLLAALSAPIAGVGLVRLAATSSLTTRVVTALDGTLIGLSTLFVSWAVVLGPVYHLPTADRAGQVGTIFYVGSTMVLTAVVLVLAMRWPGDMETLVALGVAFFWLSLSSGMYGYATTKHTYVTGDRVIDIGWFGPFLLMALAASRPAVALQAGSLRRRWLLTLVVPYASFALVACTTVAMVLLNSRLDGFLEAVGAGVVLLVLVRQLLTIRENHSLTLDLERRVEERSAAVRRSEAKLSAILRDSSDVIGLVDSKGYFAYVNEAARTVLGYDPRALVGRPVGEILHPNDEARAVMLWSTLAAGESNTVFLATRMRRSDGLWCAVEITVSALREGPDRGAFVFNMRDVSERTAMQEEMRRQATYDALTSLGNRRLFHERVRHALDRALRTGEAISVLFVDLDHFKRVNDTAGHGVGDQVLVQVAERLRTSLRPADTAARLGGDEFAVLLEGTNADQAAEVAGRVVDALAPVYAIPDGSVTVTGSVGIATCVGGKGSSDSLLRDADVAMYQAKARGRSQYALYDPRMHTRLIKQMELESGLRQALADGALRIAYQPVVDLTTGEVSSVEALVRWSGGPDGDVPPALFVPLAEERGLIQAMDRWVLREACQQVRRWQERYPRHAALRANVNLSAVELRDSGIVREVAQVLDDVGLDPACLMVEITETAVLPDPKLVAGVLQDLHALGVGVSLDDFGTGYASLATLRTFPLDEIKIDRSFVDSIESGTSGRRLLRAIIGVAEALDLHTVAEAVETPEQLAWLRRLHCGAGQGYLFSPPLPPEELDRLFALGLSVLEPAG